MVMPCRARVRITRQRLRANHWAPREEVKGCADCMQQDIEHLNADCTCITLDRGALFRAMEDAVGDSAFCGKLAAALPNLLSAQPMFLAAAHAERMQQIVSAIEIAVSLPDYQSVVLARAPEIAHYRPGPIGVFMGYDFHLSPDGPKLIEINTNAGGALINAYLLQAQRACCNTTTENGATQFDLGGVHRLYRQL